MLQRDGSRLSDNQAEAAPQYSGLAGTPGGASLVSQGSGVEEEEEGEEQQNNLAAGRMGPRAVRQRQPRKVRHCSMAVELWVLCVQLVFGCSCLGGCNQSQQRLHRLNSPIHARPCCMLPQ
jgi:hypothetical protein